MVEQTVSAKLIAWFGSLVPAIVGAAISLRFSAENTPFYARLVSFIGGVFLAHFIGGAIVDAFEINAESMIDDSIILASGIFGMATVTEMSKEVPILVKSLSDKIKSIING